MPSHLERGLDVRWTLADGRPVRSLSAGARQDRPELVLVPGLGALGYVVPTVHACASWTRVHLLDLPGFGHRRTARLTAELEPLGRALAAWLAEVPDGPVVLLGHSTGAQMALRSAVAGPDRLRLLVLAGGTFPPQARRLPSVVGRVARTLPHEQVGELPAVWPYYRRGLRRLPGLLRSTLADRPEGAVPGLVTPLLVVRGRSDRISPAPWAEQLASAGAGRVAELPGAHNVPWTHPEQLSRVLRDTVDALPA